MRQKHKLPKSPGAYSLVIALSEPLRLPIASLGRPVLSTGTYVYCGSAYGPGGIAARVNRHLRRNKTARWHVDHLTNNGKIIGVTCLPNGEECDIVRNLSKIHNAATPIPGFGSSDCKQCISHLLSLPLNFSQSFYCSTV